MDKKYKYQNDYIREKYKRVTLLVPKTDAKVLARLDEVNSKSAYILELIRKDIKGKSG